MEKINEKQFINILKTMIGEKVEIQVNGILKIRKIINNTECSVHNNIITLFDNTIKEYVIFDLNEAYKTKGNKVNKKVQANIDSLNNDTVIIIKRKYAKKLSI